MEEKRKTERNASGVRLWLGFALLFAAVFFLT